MNTANITRRIEVLTYMLNHMGQGRPLRETVKIVNELRFLGAWSK